MSPDRIQLEIVTPSRKVLSAACEEVFLPGPRGEIGLLPGHADLVSTVTAGRIHYRDGEKTSVLAIRGGFVQVRENRVVILADHCELPGEVDRDVVARERADLERRFAAADIGPDEREKFADERDWIEARTGLGEA